MSYLMKEFNKLPVPASYSHTLQQINKGKLKEVESTSYHDYQMFLALPEQRKTCSFHYEGYATSQSKSSPRWLEDLQIPAGYVKKYLKY